MSKQLRLAAFRDMTLAAYAESKPLNHDEDNVASQYRDPDGWTVHRKRAWVALLCGAHYDVIDFSIQPFLEEGTPDAQTHLRSWFRHLSAYVHGLDLVRSRPLPEALRSSPPGTVAVAFGIPGADYSVYVADAREYRRIRDLDDPGSEEGSGEAGTAIGGALLLDLPEAPLSVSALQPTSGQSRRAGAPPGRTRHLDRTRALPARRPSSASPSTRYDASPVRLLAGRRSHRPGSVWTNRARWPLPGRRRDVELHHDAPSAMSVYAPWRSAVRRTP